jgi:non-ribosomal peptide synthetase component F
VAATVANRNRPEAENLIGPLVNTVILRTNLAGDPTAREVMQRVRATCFAAFANQDLPFEELAEVLDRERGLELEALSNVMISLQNETLRPLKVDSTSKLTFEEANAYPLMPVMTLTTFDVMINLRENSHGLVSICAYKPHLFTARTIDSLLRDFEGILEQMVRRPARPISKIQVLHNAGASFIGEISS